jgi:hypothetical protein
MPAPQMFGCGALLLILLIPITFKGQLKYGFNIITTYLYTDLHSDNHHCILITLYIHIQ